MDSLFLSYSSLEVAQDHIYCSSSFEVPLCVVIFPDFSHSLRPPHRPKPRPTMAALVFQEMPWHEGEKTMHELMHVPSDLDNPTVPYLSPGAASMLERSPLLAVGTLDEQGRPWTALWGGEAGFARGLPGSHFALKVAADGKYDPVIQALLGGEDAPHMSPEETQTRLQGKLLSALAIDLETRRRVKLFGKPLMGCLREVDSEEAHKGKLVEIQLVGKIDQSLGESNTSERKLLPRKLLPPKHLTLCLPAADPLPPRYPCFVCSFIVL